MSKGQRIHKKKNPLQIWHLSVQVEIPVAAAWLAEIPSTCSPSMAQDDLQPFEKPGGFGSLTNLLPSLWAQSSNPSQNFLYRNQDNLF